MTGSVFGSHVLSGERRALTEGIRFLRTLERSTAEETSTAASPFARPVPDSGALEFPLLLNVLRESLPIERPIIHAD
jgi:hypothetical protein